MAHNIRQTIIDKLLPYVQTPGQYLGGEQHSIVKDHSQVRARVCFAFPDTYQMGMSHHGMQVLYMLVNDRDDMLCERSFCPHPDYEALLRQHQVPLYSWETYTPLREFDVLGFTLQYEVSYTNILTMLDLAGIALHSVDRAEDDPLVIAGGPGAQNPEVIAPFIDAFVIGDGEETLIELTDRWAKLRDDRSLSRPERLAQLAAACPWAYVPRFYEPEYHADGTLAALHRTRPEVPMRIAAATIKTDFDDVPIPTRPIVPNVEVAHNRIAIEIMRGCPWKCRFCQSTAIKRPLRVRSVEKILDAAREAYSNTGLDEISVLSLSSSDYPHFPELVRRLSAEFGPHRVNISVPSLRVNEQFRSVPSLMGGNRKGGLTLAPEVARDDMRDQIKKPINNSDLFEGCRQAFLEGYRRVKLYFMVGLPGEREVDLDGIIELAERISQIGKETVRRYVDVTASVSNFVPKPHTPYQWSGQKPREYFVWAHQYLRRKVKLRSVKVKCHNIDRSLLEGLLTRGDRRTADVILEAWKRGARLDAWDEYYQPQIWWQTLADMNFDLAFYAQRDRPHTEVLAWDHIDVKGGREWLEKDHDRSVLQLVELASARSEGFEMEPETKRHTPRPKLKWS